ncbi:MAG: FMN-binding protein [Nitrospirae bacterium]|nr:MAG: FMN-binding protein [Nitrospirota bacterium]
MTFKDILKITFNLAVLYIAGGVLLAAVYAKTSPVIYRNNIKEKQEALQRMMPEADNIKKLGDWHPHEKHAEYYIAQKCGEVKVKQVKDEKTGKVKEEKECLNPENLGYIVQSFGKGYSSYINILFSVDSNFVVKKIDILHHAETPGLGDEITLDYFKNRLKGKDRDHLKVVKTESNEYVQAITGATISSRAVTEDGVRKGLEFLMNALEKGEAEHGS